MAAPALGSKDRRSSALIGLGIGALSALLSNGVIPIEIVQKAACFVDWISDMIDLVLSVIFITTIFFANRIRDWLGITESKEWFFAVIIAMTVVTDVAISQVLTRIELHFVVC